MHAVFEFFEPTVFDRLAHLLCGREGLGPGIARRALEDDIEAFLRASEGVNGGLDRHRPLSQAMDWDWLIHSVCSDVCADRSPKKKLTASEFERVHPPSMPGLSRLKESWVC